MAGFSLKDCPAYDEWQFFQTEELRRQLTNSLEKLSSHYAEVNEYETAIRHARRWLALDPLHEPAHQQLMTIYEASNQRAAALRQYETCRQVLTEELGVEPSEETRTLFERIRTTSLISLPDSPPKSNLPVQSTPFIGREQELAEIQSKLKQADCHLLTLLGPGGTGKTRLAIEAAEALLEDFKHGVYFVNLAPIEAANHLPSTIAGALKFSFSEGGTPQEQLIDFLQNKEMLLILDNFEHLLSGVGLVNAIRHAAPGIKILATSRTRLMVTGEHIFTVMGMAYPESPVPLKTASRQYSAVMLFESEAGRVLGDFKLDEGNLPAVIQICFLLEGMPLGIVLAANWVRMLSLDEIATEIAQDLAFLETELRDLPHRQRSLLSVFNHSFRLLSESERAILGALSVFRGGFSREAAQKIAASSLGDLMGLIDKSILHRTFKGRLEIHELLRQFAAEKLEMNPEIEAVIRSKHSDFYCQALAVWERGLQGPRQAAAIHEIAVEIDNIRAAWAWALDNGRLKKLFNALNGLCTFLYKDRQRLELVEICQVLMDRLDSIEVSEKPKGSSLNDEGTDQIDLLKLRVRTLAWGGFSNGGLGNMVISIKLLQKCLSTLERRELAEQDTRFEKGIAYLSLPFTMENVRADEAKQLAEEAVQLFKSLDEPWWVGFALSLLGFHVASIDERIKINEESLAVKRKLGDLRGVAHSLRVIARETALQGQFKKAEALAYEALEIWMELGDREDIAAMYGVLGTILVWQGRFSEARSVEGKILADNIDLGYTQSRVAGFYAVSSLPDLFLGHYDVVREQAKHTLKLLNEVRRLTVTEWTAIVIDILGRIALAEGSFVEAEARFQECTPRYQARFSPNQLDQALAGLGYATRGMNQPTQARNYFYKVLTLSIEDNQFITLIHALPGIALLFADDGEVERAVELYALASTQGIVANSKWFDDIAGDEIAAASAKLPAEVVEAAKARGRARDLWETAEELLEELRERGWNSAELEPGPHQPEQQEESSTR